MKDERVIQGYQKIRSEMFLIVYYMTIVSFLIKILFLEQSMLDCLTEYVIVILAPIYQFIRSRTLQIGYYTEEYKKIGKQELIGGIVVMVAALVISGIYMQKRQAAGNIVKADEIIAYILSFCTAFIIIRVFVVKLEGKHNRKLAEEYDEEDEDNDISE